MNPGTRLPGNDGLAPRGFDFHLHTACSDGAVSPAEVLRLAVEAGLAGISITDHDTVDAYRQFESRSVTEGSGSRPRVLPGVEISARVGDSEVHIIGYFPDGISPALEEYLERLLTARRRRLACGVVRLREKGMDISWEDCVREAAGRVVSRTHLAQALVRKRYAGRLHRVYRDFLGTDIVSPPDEEAEGAIDAIRGMGGISVWAHPTSAQVARWLGVLCDAGLDGVEVFTPRRNRGQRSAMTALARERRLLVTGGSDWHGWRERMPLGEFRVAEDMVGELLQRIGWRAVPELH